MQVKNDDYRAEALASLADCLETARHLFLFYVCTDLTVCLAAVWSVEYVSRLYVNSHSQAPVIPA